MPNPLLDPEFVAAGSEIASYLVPAGVLALGGLTLGFARKAHREHYNARHDKLTGLLNLHGLEEVLDTSISPQAALYVDGTNQKAVNDRLGHDRGDAVIRGTAEVIMKSLRPDDILARIGGDEFLALLNPKPRKESGSQPVNPEETLEPVTRRVHYETQAFLAANPDLTQKNVGYNIAVGTVVWKEGMSIPDLKAAAEQDMYVKKAAQHAISGQYRRD